MKKHVIPIIASAAILLACNNQGSQNIKAKQKELEELKAKAEEIEKKIKTLEAEINQLDSNSVKPVVVKTQLLTLQKFEHFVEVSGTAEAEQEAFISPEVNGQIKRIFVSEGQQVSAGQILASLNTSVIESNLAQVKTNLALAETVYEKQKRLWDQKIGSEVDFLKAKNNKEALEKQLQVLETQMALSTIKAPKAGIVDEIYQKEGELAIPGVKFAHLVNLKKIKVSADIAETFLPKIKKGDTVTITFKAFDLERKATISRISQVINPNNRSFKIEIDIDNPQGTIKPNAIAVIKFRDFVHNNAIVVPSILVQKDTRNNTFVYLAQTINNQTFAKKQYVKIGYTNNGLTMITDSLKVNDQLIVEGYTEVADKKLIQIK